MEIQILRKTLPSVLLIVTPGIRPVDTENGDQNRKGTPVQAIKDGASYIIVVSAYSQRAEPRRGGKKIASDISGHKYVPIYGVLVNFSISLLAGRQDFRNDSRVR